MTRPKPDTEPDLLFGMPVLQPEWKSRQDDAREREIAKTRLLRAARLAAEAKSIPAKSIPTVEKKKPSVAPLRAT